MEQSNVYGPSARAFRLNVPTGSLIVLLGLNFLWNGLGNLAIDDKRGWKWGWANWILFLIGL